MIDKVGLVGLIISICIVIYCMLNYTDYTFGIITKQYYYQMFNTMLMFLGTFGLIPYFTIRLFGYILIYLFGFGIYLKFGDNSYALL